MLLLRIRGKKSGTLCTRCCDGKDNLGCHYAAEEKRKKKIINALEKNRFEKKLTAAKEARFFPGFFGCERGKKKKNLPPLVVAPLPVTMATLATVRSWTISQCTGHAPTRDLFAGVRLYGPRSSGKSTFINCVWRVLQDETGPFVVKAHSQDSAAATGTQHPAWLNIPISPGFRLCDTPGLSDPRSNLPPDIARLQAIRTQTRKTVVKEHYFQQSIYVIPQAYTQNCCQQQQPDGRCVCPIAAAFQEQYTAGRTTEFGALR